MSHHGHGHTHEHDGHACGGHGHHHGHDDHAMEVESTKPDKEVVFKYVYIPCDASKPMEELTMTIMQSEVVGCLIEKLRVHFAEAAQIKNEKQRAVLQQQMEEHIKKSHQGGTAQINQDMMNMMADSQTVDVVPLIPAVPAAGYVSVSLYVDDRGTAKELPTNARATGLVAAAGGNQTVLGDAFVARAYDNEAEDMVRMDFMLEEMSSDAPWVKEAWRVKAAVDEKRETGGGAATSAQPVPLVATKDQHPDGFPFSPPFCPPLSDDERKKAAEQIKAKGNELFKGGENEQAVLKYEKALRYLDAYPTLQGDDIQAARLACHNNCAAAHLKQGSYKLCMKACERALKVDAINVKSMFRKGSAHRALGEYEDAIKVLEQASALDPKDAAVKAELTKAEKDLKKFRYGW